MKVTSYDGVSPRLFALKLDGKLLRDEQKEVLFFSCKRSAKHYRDSFPEPRPQVTYGPDHRLYSLKSRVVVPRDGDQSHDRHS